MMNDFLLYGILAINLIILVILIFRMLKQTKREKYKWSGDIEKIEEITESAIREALNSFK